MTEFVTGLNSPANGITYLCAEDAFYISEYGANQVRKVYPNGSTEVVFSVPYPDELAISPDGKWMAVKTHPAGPVTVFDMQKRSEAATVEVGGSMGTGIVWDQQNNLLVARTEDLINQLIRFKLIDILAGNAEPTLLMETMDAMEGMRFDEKGTLYVAGHTNNLLMVIKADFSGVLKEIPGLPDPIIMDFDPVTHHVFVSQYLSGKVSYLGADSSVTCLIGGLNGPYGLAFDCAGNLYVNEFSGGRILKFSRDARAQCNCVKDCSEYPCDFGGVLMCHFNEADPFMSETMCVQPADVAERRLKYGDTCGPCRIHN
jgi:DNA-binding beta-propeller fold protein YncE